MSTHVRYVHNPNLPGTLQQVNYFHFPQRPWSHLSIDFLMDLPISDGFTTILVVVDRFSILPELLFCNSMLLLNQPSTLQMFLKLYNFLNFAGPQEEYVDPK
jgi:hypothetical protein